MIGLPSVFIEGVAGKLAAFRQHVVAAGLFCRDAEAAHGFPDHGELTVQVIVLRPDQEGKVQVSQVVKDRPAAGEAPRKAPPLFGQHRGAAFFPGILVAADHHGVLVLP